MKNVIAGLVLALTPTVALAETEGQELISSSFLSLGSIIMGHTSGCGEMDESNVEAKVGTLSRVYQFMEQDDRTNEELKVHLSGQMRKGVEVAEAVIEEYGCFKFNSLIVKHRHTSEILGDLFDYYIPTSGV